MSQASHGPATVERLLVWLQSHISWIASGREVLQYTFAFS